MKIKEELLNKNTSLTKALKEIQIMSRKDHLTTLSNRRDIVQRIKTEKDRLQRNKKTFALVMIDVDNFKTVNNKYGCDTGDYVLKTFADIIKIQIRKQDTASRWDGGEFLILLPETEIDGANKIAAKIKSIVQDTTFKYKKYSPKVTITMGVGVIDDFSLNINDIINRIDEAVNKGKKSGKNCIINI